MAIVSTELRTALPHWSLIHHITVLQYFTMTTVSLPLYGHVIYRVTALPTCTVAHITLQHFPPIHHGHSISNGHSIYRITVHTPRITMATVCHSIYRIPGIWCSKSLHFPPKCHACNYCSCSTHHGHSMG